MKSVHNLLESFRGRIKLRLEKNPNDKDFLWKELHKNRNAYRRLICLRINGKVEEDEFLTKEKLLNYQGIYLRRFLCIRSDLVGGVFCSKCHRFFVVSKLNRESFSECSQHKNKKECTLEGIC